MAPEAGPLFQTQAFQNGLFSIQNPAAGLVIRLLDPQPGQQILDLCSAPGGKTTAIAERFDDSGLILATDLYPGRLLTLLDNCCRLGLTSIFPIAADGNALPTSARFHRVLVDAPCSSLGILNHHPEIRWHRQESDLTHLARRQSRLLQSAAQYVCPDGLLVYSTCTLEPEENERVVESFLRNHTHFRLEPASEYLDLVCDGPYLSILPHQHHLDGAFAARLRKVA
jgi:16S rRNA (cytosine967-C5)-methyltransferase